MDTGAPVAFNPALATVGTGAIHRGCASPRRRVSSWPELALGRLMPTACVSAGAARPPRAIGACGTGSGSTIAGAARTVTTDRTRGPVGRRKTL